MLLLVIAAIESFSDLPLLFFLKKKKKEKKLVSVILHVIFLPSCGFTVSINDKKVNQVFLQDLIDQKKMQDLIDKSVSM